MDYRIGWLTRAGILLLLLYRPEYTHPWGSKSFYNRIGLEQLTSKSSAELIRSILQVGEAVPELEALILDRAAGNPLFMEEITHTLLENESIRCKGGRCLLIKDVAEIQVPDTIEGIIAARMDRLEDNIKRTMQVASVIGRDFAYRILETITEMKQGLKSYLLNLQGLEFIYEKSLFPELEYVFKHALTREVAYNSLLQRRRKEIHEKIGRAIEAHYPERLEEFYEVLARHYSRSDNYEKAYHFLKLSGDKVMRNHSVLEAFCYYKDAMDALKKLPESEENTRQQLAIIHSVLIPIIVLGFPKESLSILQAGGRIATTIDDKKSLIRFYSNMGLYYTHAGRLTEGRKYSGKAFEEAEKIQDIESMAQAGPDFLGSYFVEGDYKKAIDLASRVTNQIEKNQMQAETFGGPANVYLVLAAFCACSMGMLGDFEGALTLCERAAEYIQRGLKILSALQTKADVSIAHLFLGEIFWSLGLADKAAGYLKKAAEMFEEMGMDYWLDKTQEILEQL